MKTVLFYTAAMITGQCAAVTASTADLKVIANPSVGGSAALAGVKTLAVK